MLDAEDRQEMLAACGVAAQVPAGDLLVSPPEYPDPSLALAGDMLDQVNPVALATAEDVESLGIVAGETGTVITIQGRDYRILSARASASGFTELELGAV